MPTYESVPATCEAEQYMPDAQRELPDGVYQDAPMHTPYVITAHGQRAYLEPGDFIVKEPDGSGHYPVKPKIFAKRWRLKADPQPAAETIVVTASPHDGGCWYCRRVDEGLVFCCEFDTYVHPHCARLARDENPDDREAAIIAAEVLPKP